MLKKILVGIVAVIAVILIAAAFRPADFRVERKISINAPAEVVFAQVSNVHKWEAWSPWAKLDPHATQTYNGPAEGVGASFSWSGNNEIGEGRMTETESTPSSLVRYKLEFTRPFVSTNFAEFTFKTEGPQTAVSWVMTGKNGYLAKIFTLFMDCDKIVGGEFEQGLAQLKAVAEAVKVDAPGITK